MRAWSARENKTSLQIDTQFQQAVCSSELPAAVGAKPPAIRKVFLPSLTAI